MTRIFALKDASETVGALRQRIITVLGARFRLRVLSANELLDYFVTQILIKMMY